MLEKPKTLAEILSWLDNVDNGLIPEPTPEDRAHVGALLVAKIDNTKGVIDELEFQEARLRKAAKELSEGARQVANRVESIKAHMAFHMQAKGFSQLPGECWKARLKTGLTVEPKREASVLDVEDPAMAGFVRVKFEWNKAEIKKALEALDPAAMEIAELKPSASVSIVVNKGKLT